MRLCEFDEAEKQRLLKNLYKKYPVLEGVVQRMDKLDEKLHKEYKILQYAIKNNLTEEECNELRKKEGLF